MAHVVIQALSLPPRKLLSQHMSTSSSWRWVWPVSTPSTCRLVLATREASTASLVCSLLDLTQRYKSYMHVVIFLACVELTESLENSPDDKRVVKWSCWALVVRYCSLHVL